MALIKGPQTVQWGDNVIYDVEEINFEYEIDSDDRQTVQGKTRVIDGPHKATATLQLLASDIPILAALLPQHFVANGQQLSTGETVNHAQGAIDVAPADCDVNPIYNNLDVTSCGNPGQVTRLVNARTRLAGIEIDNKLQVFMVEFIGESEADEAVIQIFKEGSIAVVS